MSIASDAKYQAQRFFDRVQPEPMSGCWLWTGAIAKNGYGRTSAGYAHRTAYELNVGPIPAGLDLDHKCRTRSCCNPEHLEPVTRSENLRRGDMARTGLSHRNARKTHCKRGHEFTSANTYTVHGTGARQCKQCHALRERGRL